MEEKSDTDVMEDIRAAVADRYSLIGQTPGHEQAIPAGRSWAEVLGYPAALLDAVPDVAIRSFTGIGTPILQADPAPGEVVLDLGCGAGLDAILAARSVGPDARVYGVDMAPGMLARAREAVAEAGLTNVTILEGTAEELPLPDNSLDVAVVNGLFNLAPDKAAVARNLARVLRPGGRLVGAEIVITDDRPPNSLDLESWFR